MRRKIATTLVVGVLSVSAFGQAGTDIDPDALKVLQAALQPVKDAQTYSFHARIARDRPATNGQILTYFQDEHITVSRPDKIRVDIAGEHHAVQLYSNAGHVSLFAPKASVYASAEAPKTIDQAIDALEKRDISFPMFYLFRSDPYAAIVDGIKTGYVIGTVNVYDKSFVHLAFTEPEANWQIWVELTAKPTLRRYEVVYTKRDLKPRVVVEFSDWNLAATPAQDTFVFKAPADAHKIDFLRNAAEEK